MKVLTYNEIDREEWSALVKNSATGTWFQTPEAFDFFNAQKDLFMPFVVAIEKSKSRVESQESRNLRALCVGYVTKEKSRLKQFLTRRAIIIGGPVIADDAGSEEVEALMCAVCNQFEILDFLALRGTIIRKRIFKFKIFEAPIYIETRNFNDYSRWKGAFERAGFEYKKHLNFHVETHQAWDEIEAKIGKHRKKYIRLSFRDGATIEENPTIEQVRAYYDILLDLYRTKVKMPLQPWEFFEKLYHCPSCKYLLALYNGQVVGGSICMLLQRRGVYEWYACGRDGIYKNIYPSSVTKYAGMKFAHDNNYPVFDMMGAGKPDEEYGVREFKAEFGGELVEHGRFICVTKPVLYKFGTLGVKILKALK